MENKQSDIALTFCRECLGWEHCEVLHEETILRVGAPGHLNYTDLAHVMAAVEIFIDKSRFKRKRLGIGATRGALHRKWHVTISRGGITGKPQDKNIIAHHTAVELEEAALEACIKAQRVLSEIRTRDAASHQNQIDRVKGEG